MFADAGESHSIETIDARRDTITGVTSHGTYKYR